MNKLKVGIVGATGMVGQQFIVLLEKHPWFEVISLSASARSAGQSYARAVEGRWKLSTPCPDYVKQIPVMDGIADLANIAKSVDIIFCALDMDKEAIQELELAYAAAGVAVISNNSAHRWTQDVPMLIPEVNTEHVKLIDIQRKNRDWTKGLIAVKPNCSIQSYTIILTALRDFLPRSLHVTSMQAVSGAGRTLDTWPEMADNVIPYIGGEEEKSEREPLKIWGEVNDKTLKLSDALNITATCVRVPVSDGHLADVSVKFDRKPDKAEVITAIENFAAPLADLKLPSSPQKLIHYLEDDDRPQTKLDRVTDNGMAVSMGRLRELQPENPFDWRFISLAHNTVRGAAGGAILMAELLTAKGYIA